MWPASESSASDDPRMPATTSTSMKATISANAPASRRASPSEWSWPWLCAIDLITAGREDHPARRAPKKKRATRGGEGSRALTREDLESKRESRDHERARCED